MSLDHDRILNDIKKAGHAVNIESIRQHHPDIWSLFHDDDEAEETLKSITKPLQSFITTWEVYSCKTLVLPLVPGEPYDFSVKWGDGSGEEKIQLLRGWNNADEKNTNTYTHVYPAPGVYTVKITGAIRGFHRGYHRHEPRTLCEALRWDGVLVSVNQWGLVQLTSCQNMFRNSRNADLIYECNAPDLRWCTDMSGMFSNSENFNCDISKWDVSNITNMCGMFSECTVFNQPIGNWNVGKVTNMNHMFWRCRMFNQPMWWNVSSVTNMGELFRECEVFNQYVNWDVSNVTNMRNMFCGCHAFNQEIWNWNVSNVTDMNHMFHGCKTFNRSIGGWDVSNVTNMSHMFYGCHTFNQVIGGWDVSKVTDMSSLLCFCYAFNQPLWWDVNSVNNMRYMFLDCKKFNKPIGGWEVNKLSDVTGMFKGCNAFDQYIGGWMFLSPDVPWYGLPMFDNQGLSIRAGLRPHY
jgi:surface protein